MTFATLFVALITLPAASAAADRPVMLDFTATWCGPCRQMKPAVEQLAREGYPIKAVDIDRAPELAERYKVTGVPAFVVIDPADGRELGRTTGYQPAANLTALYDRAAARLARRPRPGPRDEEAVPAEDLVRGDDAPGPQADAEPEPETEPEPEPEADAPRAPRPVNPKPWETVVRIKVDQGNGSIGFGSGTVISSTPQESIILTCAHIFKVERGPQHPPDRFPFKIAVDLFDGNLSGPRRNQVHYANETFAGKAIDYDFGRDVGLIRIRPGRRLPYARVVPAHWKPKERFGMITVGCSQGHDATAWSTVILNPSFHGLAGHDVYEAIECLTAPSQGRSGGGLFTTDGYVAGVCDFAEPRGNHGLYASPRSIYHILDRNNLMALYAPARGVGRSGALVADNGGPRRAADAGRGLRARAQSPGRDDPGAVSLPPPDMLGIKPPALVRGDRSVPARRGAWVPHAAGATPARTAELKMDAAADPDPFVGAEPAAEEADAVEAAATEPAVTAPRTARGSWRAGRSPLPALTGAGAN